MADEDTTRDHIEMIADAITFILSENKDKSNGGLNTSKYDMAGRGETLG